MSLSGSKNQVSAITRDLALHWEETRNYWRDSKGEEFERRFIDELLARVDRTIPAIEKLDQLLTKVRSDCE